MSGCGRWVRVRGRWLDGRRWTVTLPLRGGHGDAVCSSLHDFCAKRQHGLDQGVEVAQLGAVIGDADADREAAAEDRVRRNGDPAYLQFGQDLLVQGVETLVRRAPAGVTEADRVQGNGRKQLEPGLPLDAPGEMARLVDVCLDGGADAGDALLLHRHPDLEGSKPARKLQAAVSEIGAVR